MQIHFIEFFAHSKDLETILMNEFSVCHQAAFAGIYNPNDFIVAEKWESCAFFRFQKSPESQAPAFSLLISLAAKKSQRPLKAAGIRKTCCSIICFVVVSNYFPAIWRS